eukprot:CAMPEP_0118883826 /NCGR_PEP_ID=MMETSP1163-20130328/22806_1 /TAXON_ID=124430 /ORGANISM="Phaeomonas parva, Strain CCMP2877" /LENGTH=794 /DNA_ID=CAMNT_0006821377 /DNA_START=125 /DNA_END=2506 /DNA_ORIENTATION=-
MPFAAAAASAAAAAAALALSLAQPARASLAYEYPDGPTSCCSAHEDGYCGCRASIDGPGDPVLVLVYVWVALGLIMLAAHGILRSKQSDVRGRAADDCFPCGRFARTEPTGAEPLEPAKHAPFVEAEDGNNAAALGAGGGVPPGLKYQGYCRDAFGTWAYRYVRATSIGIWLVFLCILIDKYNDCEVRGPDAQCFYGNFPITGSWYTNAQIYVGWWAFTVVWFGVLFFFSRDLRNWFRRPCDLSEAEVIWVFQPEREPENFTTTPTWLVRRARVLKAKLRGNRPRGTAETLPVMETKGCALHPEPLRCVTINCLRYLLTDDGLVLPELDGGGRTFGNFNAALKKAGGVDGLTRDEAAWRREQVGENRIAYEIDSWKALLFGEFVTVMFFYQCATYTWWFWESYLFTALVEASIVFGSMAFAIYVRHINQRSIKAMAELRGEATVIREGTPSRGDSADIVPGDALIVEGAGWTAPCDMVLVRGTAVTDEAGLTGESMPVAKAARPLDFQDMTVYDEGKHAKQTLFAGTTVLQASEDAVAVCTRTGITTSKGRIIGLILKPPKMTFKYDEEFTVVFAVLLAYGAVLFTYSLSMQSARGSNANWTVQLSIGIFTISQMVSPLLPVFLEVGPVMSAKRLRERGIFCVNPKRVAICGKVRIAAFDKTGTITKEGLEFAGVWAVGDGGPEDDALVMPFNPGSPSVTPALLRGIACCHSLTKYGDQLVGNEVEIRMFAGSGWDLEGLAGQPPRVFDPIGGDALIVARRFDFDHARMAMSVVVREAGGGGGHAMAFVKGAPE